MREREPCSLCGRWDYLQLHHVFEGQSLRRISDKYGATMHICPACHRNIHAHPLDYLWLKKESQLEVMERLHWTIEDWHRHFGKSYLEE